MTALLIRTQCSQILGLLLLLVLLLRQGGCGSGHWNIGPSLYFLDVVRDKALSRSPAMLRRGREDLDVKTDLVTSEHARKARNKSRFGNKDRSCSDRDYGIAVNES